MENFYIERNYSINNHIFLSPTFCQREEGFFAQDEFLSSFQEKMEVEIREKEDQKIEYEEEIKEQNSPEYIKQQYEEQIKEQNSPAYIKKQYEEQNARQREKEKRR